MPETTNLGLAVSSNQNDSVLEYWNKMLNETDGNFVKIDTAFGQLDGQLKESIDFSIPDSAWVSEVNGPFKASATVTLSDTVIRDGSVVEAYFSDIVNSAGVVLYSVTQSGTNVVLVFYANEVKSVAISGFIKYVYGVEAPEPPAPTVDAVLENNSWATIRAVCEAGNAANYWAVGDTKTDTGTDNKTRTFQIVDMQGLYNKHVVFEQVELDVNMYYVWDTDVIPIYRDSDMRSTHLPAAMAKYSNELQGELTDTTYKSIATSVLVDLTDKLFLAAEKETLGSNGYSALESDALTQFQYYVTNSASSYRIKKYLYNGSYFADAYWLRTGIQGSGQTACMINSTGTSAGAWVSGQHYVAPCFSF